MDTVQVAILTVISVAVGILIPLMIQFWFTLRQVQRDLIEAKALVIPVLADIRTVTQQLAKGAQLTSIIAVAVSAGVQAWTKARQNAPPVPPQGEDTP